MGWIVGGSGAVLLAAGCVVVMGLLVWLLFKLTSQTPARGGVKTPKHEFDRRFAGPSIDSGGLTRAGGHRDGRRTGRRANSDSVRP